MADMKAKCSICEDILSKFHKVDIDDPNITVEDWAREAIRIELVKALDKLHQDWGTPPYFETNQDNKGD